MPSETMTCDNPRIFSQASNPPPAHSLFPLFPQEVRSGTVSLWSYVNSERSRFTNPLYIGRTQRHVILPVASLRRIELWTAYYVSHNPVIRPQVRRHTDRRRYHHYRMTNFRHSFVAASPIHAETVELDICTHFGLNLAGSLAANSRRSDRQTCRQTRTYEPTDGPTDRWTDGPTAEHH